MTSSLNQGLQRAQAYRQFASDIAGQVVDGIEALIKEFEKEMTSLSKDISTYREELNTVAELLSQQLGREKQLHAMLQAVLGRNDKFILGSSEVNQTIQAKSAQALEMQQPMTSAETEVNRIRRLLSEPLITPSPVPQVLGPSSPSLPAPLSLNMSLPDASPSFPAAPPRNLAQTSLMAPVGAHLGPPLGMTMGPPLGAPIGLGAHLTSPFGAPCDAPFSFAPPSPLTGAPCDVPFSFAPQSPSAGRVGNLRFEELDTNGDGIVTKDEFIKAALRTG